MLDAELLYSYIYNLLKHSHQVQKVICVKFMCRKMATIFYQQTNKFKGMKEA